MNGAEQDLGPETSAWLSKLGVGLEGENRDGPIYGELIRIARKLDKSGMQTIGLWPASGEVAVPPLAIRLGAALADLSQGTAAFIDANVHFPALPIRSTTDGASEQDESESIFSTRWLHGSLALVLPRWIGDVGAGVPQLMAMIDRNRDAFAHMLVDLTGFDTIGDHRNAIELLDGVVVVGRAGSTRETELLDIHQQIPATLNLGVVLVG